MHLNLCCCFITLKNAWVRMLLIKVDKRYSLAFRLSREGKKDKRGFVCTLLFTCNLTFEWSFSQFPNFPAVTLHLTKCRSKIKTAIVIRLPVLLFAHKFYREWANLGRGVNFLKEMLRQAAAKIRWHISDWLKGRLRLKVRRNAASKVLPVAWAGCLTFCWTVLNREFCLWTAYSKLSENQSRPVQL